MMSCRSAFLYFLKLVEFAINLLFYHFYGLMPEERTAIGYIDFHSGKDDETDDDE